MSPLDTILILAIILFSTLIRAAFGFGNALLAMPLLILVAGSQVAAPLVALTGTVVSVMILALDWRSIQFAGGTRLALASILGIPVGLLFLKGSHEALISSVLAFVILSFSAYSLIKPRGLHLRNDALAWPIGFFAGILGGAYNTNGPPVAIYGTLRGWSAAEFRATLQGYFLVTGVAVLAGHFAAGLWTPYVMRMFLLSVPVALLAVAGGTLIGRRIPKARYEGLIHVLLIAISIFTLFEVWRGAL